MNVGTKSNLFARYTVIRQEEVYFYYQLIICLLYSILYSNL